jgi:predicted nucleic acid-binding Zn ribbon protein
MMYAQTADVSPKKKKKKERKRKEEEEEVQSRSHQQFIRTVSFLKNVLRRAVSHPAAVAVSSSSLESVIVALS